MRQGKLVVEDWIYGNLSSFTISYQQQERVGYINRGVFMEIEVVALDSIPHSLPDLQLVIPYTNSQQRTNVGLNSRLKLICMILLQPLHFDYLPGQVGYQVAWAVQQCQPVQESRQNDRCPTRRFISRTRRVISTAQNYLLNHPMTRLRMRCLFQSILANNIAWTTCTSLCGMCQKSTKEEISFNMQFTNHLVNQYSKKQTITQQQFRGIVAFLRSNYLGIAIQINCAEDLSIYKELEAGPTLSCIDIDEPQEEGAISIVSLSQ